MLRAGLTGGIACGKSAVAEMFASLGAHILNADTLAHELYRPGEPVYHELVKRFGREIVKPDGAIDRAKLAALAFDGGRVEELNRIVHPAVIARQQEMMAAIGAKDPEAVVLAEAALIFEAGAGQRFDKIIVVTCKPEQKAARLAQRMGVNEAAAQVEVERRMKSQIPDEEKARRADYVIDNSGSLEETRRQVEKVFTELKALAQGAA
jgi:dephospho-CoA kinase